MPRGSQFCAVCGKPWPHSTYCSKACKQKAYRQRKKQQKQSAAATIDMETYQMQERIISAFGQTTAFNFGQFYSDFGKEAYVRFVNITYGIFNSMAEELLNGRS